MIAVSTDIGPSPSGEGRWVPYIDRYRSGESRDRILFDLVADDIRRLGRKPALLDIGCGRGFDSELAYQRKLADLAAHFIGIEPDSSIAAGSYFDTVHRCFLEEAPIAENSVDLAYAVMVVEHLQSPQGFWDKIHRVLKDGGIFWGFTVDARHWFSTVSLLAERAKIKDRYFNWLFRTRPADRYENYPVYYRSNTPEQIARYTEGFRARDCVNFSRETQCIDYLPRPLHPIATWIERQGIRRGKPGSLLVVRLVK